MARLNRGANGPFSGKVGSIIGSSWKGINYIKGLPTKSTKPRSPLQIAQNEKFKFAVEFLAPIKKIVDTGFSNINPTASTGFNMAISHLMKFSIKGTYPNLRIDYPSVYLTQGPLTVPESIEMGAEDGMFKLNWSGEIEDHLSRSDDQLYVLFHVIGSHDFRKPYVTYDRDLGSVEFPVPREIAGKKTHVYAYFMSKDKMKWSNSFYIGKIEPPQEDASG